LSPEDSSEHYVLGFAVCAAVLGMSIDTFKHLRFE